MPRPRKCRYVGFPPDFLAFKPLGVPASELEEILLSVDEMEAVRLADLEGMYQEQAAEKMNISRQTFGNTIQSAHRKIANFLVNGKVLRIEGGTLTMEERKFKCAKCGHEWCAPFGAPRPEQCPECKDRDIRRTGAAGTATPSGKGLGLGRGRCCGRRKQR